MKTPLPVANRVDARFGIIIPACNEAVCLASVLAELRTVLTDTNRFVFSVGVNGSTDGTACVAAESGAVVGETGKRGYGHGCKAGIDALAANGLEVDAYIFFAADGANDPRDIPALIREYEQGADLVIGSRTRRIENWRAMNLHYVATNLLFGTCVGLLTGRFYTDLGPLRLIESDLFRTMGMQEWTFGWTIEAQVRAAMAGATSREIPVRERERVAGEQKVSRVSSLHSARIGLAILRAGCRARFRGEAEIAGHSLFGNRNTSPHAPRETTVDSAIQGRLESGKAARSRFPQKT